MINIVSTFYISNSSSEQNNLRIKELEDSLINNLLCPIIEKIHLFVDNEPSLNRLNEISNNSDKIVIIEIGKKPKYSDFFEYILNNLKDNICMILNADIYLHEYQEDLIKNLIDNKIVYTLTRYEYDMSHPLIDGYCGSHDCYIFNSKFINASIINEDTTFYQNFPGIETHIIKSLCDQGFKVYNPCMQLKIVHLHKSDVRNHGHWIGLHRDGDHEFFNNSCWCVRPITL